MVRRFGIRAGTFALAEGFALAASGSAPAATPVSPTTFTFTGGNESFVVPDGVTEITVDAYGAEGGAGGTCATTSGFPVHCGTPGAGGLGAHVTSTVAVTPGESLTIVGGGKGGAGASRMFAAGEICANAAPIPGSAGKGGFGGGADGGSIGCPTGAGWWRRGRVNARARHDAVGHGGRWRRRQRQRQRC
jgi:hypothetical protein